MGLLYTFGRGGEGVVCGVTTRAEPGAPPKVYSIPYSGFRTTRSCQHKALPSRLENELSIEKDLAGPEAKGRTGP